MPTFERGDVVRVPLPYTDRRTRQHRPALVVSGGPLGDRDALLWVVMITSAENRGWPGDIAIGTEHIRSGLPAPSIIRSCKIATVESDQVGRVEPALPAEVVRAIRGHLGIGAAA